MKLGNKEKIIFANFWLYLLTFSIFFPLRKVFDRPENNIFGFYSDFTATSIYLPTLITIAGIVFIIISKDVVKLKKILFLYASLLITIALSILINHPITWINYFYALQIIAAIVLHGTIVALYEYIKKTRFLYFFITMVFFEAIISIIQFSTQSSLGLYKLGEPHLDYTTSNIARILAEGLIFLRSYGTFPHPNAESAFFVSGIIFCAFLYIKSNLSKLNYYLLIVSGGTLVGLFLTFSRAGILGAMLGLVSLGTILYLKNVNRTRIVFFGSFCLVIGIISIYSLKNLYQIRADVNNESTSERVTYNIAGFNMIKNSPILGIGPGNSIIKIADYSEKNLEIWEHQPIHNYYLITAADIGILGLIIIIYLLLKPTLSLKDIWSKNNPSNTRIALTCIIASFMVLMLFDHYFYTIEQNRLLIWLFSGIALGEMYLTKKSDTIQNDV